MLKSRIVVLIVILAVVAGCTIKVAVQPEIELPPIPIPDNPYLQMLRALESIELDAAVVLNEGLFTIPKLPVAGDVNVGIPDKLTLNVTLQIFLEKTYKENAEQSMKNLISITPRIDRAKISASEPLPVQAGGIKIELKEVEYDGEELSTELALRLDLVAFFVSPATGIPVGDVNQDVAMEMVKEVRIRSLRGNFEVGEELALNNLSLALAQGSRVELNDVLFRNEEHIEGSLSLALKLKELLWSRQDGRLTGKEGSLLEISSLGFSYNDGALRIQGSSEEVFPFRLAFEGGFSSSMGSLEVASGSELAVKRLEAVYPREGDPEAETEVQLKWQVSKGSLELPGVTMVLDGLSLDMGSILVKSDAGGSLLDIRGADLDALLAFQSRSQKEILETINSGVKSALKKPVTSFKATRIGLPGQNFRIRDFNMTVRDWKDIQDVSGKLRLRMEPGHLLDFEVGLAIDKGVIMKSALEIDAFNLPLLFEYDGEKAELRQDEAFQVGGTFRTLSPMVVYRSSVG